MQDLKVIVIGAGIGGLAAAIALSQAGFGVEIYDRVQELRPVGAGISLWSNGVKVLNRLGLGQEIAAIGGPMRQMQYRWMDGALLNDISLEPLIKSVGQPPYPVARAALQTMLMRAYVAQSSDAVRLGHDCVAIEETENQVIATFSNGVQAQGDLLIVANGMRSNLREYVLGHPLLPKYAGYVNWNGLVDASAALAPKNTWMIYVGNHQRASMMPVADDRLYFFFDMPLDPVPESQDYRAELSHYFQGWAEPVQQLIAACDPGNMARLAIHDVGPIDRLVRGKVALIGDAAHTTCPDLGQGGCQALEDAWVLVESLVVNNLGVEDALERYEARRLDRVNSLVNKARARAEMIHGHNPAVTQQWYEQLSTESPSDVTDAIAKTILTGVLH
ncbi:MAG: FAD-dependent urate hydroxylase HpxO [Alkalinema sp. RU_4_3]|nr:FAD-dependent urate hydroxylase HpxO [Alkalinema sp. RU_4_3]